MARYYFFKLDTTTVTGRNGNRILMRKLFPLPGQTMPVGIPLDTAVPGRMSLADRSRAMRYPLGTVFGVRTEGRAGRLVQLHDHNTSNYNLTHLTIYACGRLDPQNGRPAETRYLDGDPHRPDGDMRASLLALLRDGNAAEQPEQPAGSPAAECDFREGPEMDNIERALAGTGTMRDILTRCLDLSRLRDRMRKGVVKFRYLKASDSSVRTAYGTRCPEVIALYRAAATREDGYGQTVGDGVHFHYIDCGRGNEAPDENPLRNFITSKFLLFEEDSFIPASDTEAIRALRYDN